MPEIQIEDESLYGESYCTEDESNRSFDSVEVGKDLDKRSDKKRPFGSISVTGHKNRSNLSSALKDHSQNQGTEKGAIIGAIAVAEAHSNNNLEEPEFRKSNHSDDMDVFSDLKQNTEYFEYIELPKPMSLP